VRGGHNRRVDEATFDTLESSVHLDRPEAANVVRRRSILYRATTIVLTLLVGLAVVDAFDVADVYGVKTDHVTASGGGYTLDVRYGTVSRPALATPFEITVTKPGGFDGPVALAVDRGYLAIWDENGLDPDPSESSTDAEFVYWVFEPPALGETLVVSYDARIEPAVQSGKSGSVAIVDDDGSRLVSVRFRTRVLP
jgi:hypothetical protein